MDGVVDWFLDLENWRGPAGIPTRFVEHIGLSALAIGVAALVALPIAVWLGHIGRGGTLAINVGNVGRAIPTYAALVLLGVSLGRGNLTTTLALVLFALPPLLTNAYVGMREVSRATVESARGMGMSGRQIVRRVELPLAMPLIMNGVRLAAVQVIATATIAGLISGPGLGRIITSGFANQDQAQIIGGAILVAVLAFVVEVVLAKLQKATDPIRRRSVDIEKVTEGERERAAQFTA